MSLLPGKLALRYLDVGAESDDQMRVFDTFGPLARAAFDYMPRDPDVKTFLATFRMEFQGASRFKPTLDLLDPETDAKFAAFIDRIIVEKTGHSIAWHKLQPIKQTRPRLSLSRPTRPSGARSPT